MLYSSDFFARVLLMGLVVVNLSNAVASPRTLFPRYPSPTSTTLQAHNSFSGSAFAFSSGRSVGIRNGTSNAASVVRTRTSTHQSRDENRTSNTASPTHTMPSGRPSNFHNQSITAAPTGYPSSCPGCCIIGDSRPSCNGTWDGPPISDLAKECVLWNSSCNGDKDAAAQNVLDNLVMLEEKPCWRSSLNASFHCTDYEPAETLLAMKQIKDWLRGPDCMSRSLKLAGPVTTTVANAETTAIITTSMTAGPGDTCCGNPIIEASNVDIYYWLQPGANTACLSTIGDNPDSNGNSLYEGGTTDSGTVYWGCTARHPKTTTSSTFVGDFYTGSVSVVTVVQSVITTEVITTVNSITFKAPVVNPWAPPDCLGVTSPSRSSNTSAQISAASKAIEVRGHSLLVPRLVTEGIPVSTVVSGSFTFTSPSIYANFHSIRAADGCGPIGSEALISETMLAFAPGELSTIAGPLYNPVGTSYTTYSTKVLDLGDLPCPPQSVMEENWYNPAPGNPYRPVIALPDKVKEIDPSWRSCSASFFTCLDPPRTLNPSTAMVPDPTSSHPAALPDLPKPSPTPNPGPKKTDVDGEAIPTPKPDPKATGESGQPSREPDNQGQFTYAPAQLDPQQQGNNPAAVTGDLNQQVSKIEDLQSPSTPVAHPGVVNEPEASPQASQANSAPSLVPQNQDPRASDQVNPLSQAGLQWGNQQADGGKYSVEENPVQQNTPSPYFDPPSPLTQPDGSRPHPSGFDFAPDDSPTNTSPTNSDPDDPSFQKSNPANGISVADAGRSESTNDGLNIIHIPAEANVEATTIANHAIIPVANGASIDGAMITAGAAPISISGKQFSMDNSNQVYIEGTPYHLPTQEPAQAITLANGAVVEPVQDAISIYGTTLITGAAMTAFGQAVSFGSSNNIILAPSGNNNLVAANSADLAHLGEAAPMIVTSGEGISLTSKIFEAAKTLSPGAAAVTVDGVAVSLNPASEVVVGSKTVGGPADTLSPGSPAQIVSGIAISLNSDGQLVVGSRTDEVVGTLSPGKSVISVNGVAVSWNSAGQLMAGSQTLATESVNELAITLDSAGDVMAESKTFTVGSARGGLGHFIMGGFQTQGPQTAPSASPTSANTAVITSAGGAKTSSIPTSQSRAAGTKSLLPWRSILVIIAVIMIH
ncbi:hypothetical protein ACLMJK_007258 [Lecanora helva]